MLSSNLMIILTGTPDSKPIRGRLHSPCANYNHDAIDAYFEDSGSGGLEF